MNKKINWGIIGLGKIAHKFAQALEVLPDAELIAVASRTKENAKQFGNKYNVLKRYSNYDDIIKDNDVEVVYIATPHSSHKELTIKCLKAGKAVLCEKPIAVNQSEMLEMIECSKKNQIFLMEALWTRFLPTIEKAMSLINEGVIGEVKLIKADFGFKGNDDINGRLLNPDLAGGALLDIGIYPLFLFSLIYEELPKDIISLVKFAETGVDVDDNIILSYSKDRIAQMSISFNTYIPHDAMIIGEKGIIRIPNFLRSTSLTLEIEGKDQEEISFPHLYNGYEYEAMEVMNCLRKGKIESELMPLEKSLALVKIMDDIRIEWGFKYPNE